MSSPLQAINAGTTHAYSTIEVEKLRKTSKNHLEGLHKREYKSQR